PHFLFLWRVKEKENAPLAVEKKKKAFWVLIGSLVRKTNYGTCVSAECLSICSAFLSAAAGAELLDNLHASGSGNRSRSNRYAAALPKTQCAVSQSDCRYAPESVFFFFCTVNGTSSFSWQDKEKEDVGLKQSALAKVQDHPYQRGMLPNCLKRRKLTRLRQFSFVSPAEIYHSSAVSSALFKRSWVSLFSG
ncbi:MAG: hypothetical protein IKB58_04810, partial [Oscillospiraceae bacterium]|nr:hypothetical protein [Oscillospiraceae bacterium]